MATVADGPGEELFAGAADEEVAIEGGWEAAAEALMDSVGMGAIAQLRARKENGGGGGDGGGVGDGVGGDATRATESAVCGWADTHTHSLTYSSTQALTQPGGVGS